MDSSSDQADAVQGVRAIRCYQDTRIAAEEGEATFLPKQHYWGMGSKPFHWKATADRFEALTTLAT